MASSSDESLRRQLFLLLKRHDVAATLDFFAKIPIPPDVPPEVSQKHPACDVDREGSAEEQRVAGMVSEDVCRSLFPTVLEWYKMNHGDSKPWLPRQESARRCFEIAMLSTASFDELLRSYCALCAPWAYLIPAKDRPELFTVYRRRAAFWPPDAFVFFIGRCFWWADRWDAYRQAFQEGLCPRLLDIRVVNPMMSRLAARYARGDELADFFRQNPDLLQNEFMYIVEHEYVERQAQGADGVSRLSHETIDLSSKIGVVGADGVSRLSHETFWWYYSDADRKTCFDAIVALSNEGLLDRSRLLTALLRLFGNGFGQEVCCHIDLYRRLAPTLDEMKLREDRYYELCESNQPEEVQLGFDMILALGRAKRLDESKFLRGVEPFLLEKKKERAFRALGLLARIAKRNPALRDNVAELALVALRHSHRDVQCRAVALLRDTCRPDDSNFWDETAAILPALSPSVRLELWPCLPESLKNAFADTETETLAGTLAEPPAARELEPLNRAEPLEPLNGFDELIDLYLSMVDDQCDLGDMERLIDGISRFGVCRPDGFELKMSAVRKKLSGGILYADRAVSIDPFWSTLYLFYKTDLDRLVAVFAAESTSIRRFPKQIQVVSGWKAGSGLTIYARRPATPRDTFGQRALRWLCDWPFELWHMFHMPGRRLSAFTQLWRRRMTACFFRLAEGKSHTLLSIPTHRGGWIDPRVLTERIQTAVDSWSDYDEADKLISLYRLAVERRDDALKQWETVARVPSDPYFPVLRAMLSGASEYDAKWPTVYRVAFEADLFAREKRSLYRYDDRANPSLCRKARWFDLLDVAKRQRRQRKRMKTQLTANVRQRADRLLCPPLFFDMPGDEFLYTGNAERAAAQWVSWLMPKERSAFYWIYEIVFLASLLETNGDDDNAQASFEPLLNSAEPFTFPAACGAMLVMSMRSDGFASLGVDLFIQGIADGRIGSDVLVDAARYWIRNGFATRSRWCRRMKMIAEQSSRHADTIRKTLEALVPSFAVRELNPFLELLRDLTLKLDTPVDDAECRAFLAGLKGNGKAAKTAAMLLGK